MKEKESPQYCVVTGASQGLGSAFANELARRKYNLILVSLPEQGLPELSARIRQMHAVDCIYYETDFSEDRNILMLAEWINERFAVHVLINNAGLGGTLPFDQSNPEYLNKIIQVNIKATALLTRLLLPNLKQCESAYVLNVSSVATFSPVGYKTIYPASKAFVHCFSRSLNAELSNSNVFISVIHPGPMATNKYIVDRIARKGWLGRVSTQHPDRIARFALDRLQKKDSVIMVAPLLWLLSAILPIWIKLPLMTSIVRKELSNETSAGNRS